MARFIVSGRSTCFTSTVKTFTPHGSVSPPSWATTSASSSGAAGHGAGEYRGRSGLVNITTLLESSLESWHSSRVSTPRVASGVGLPVVMATPARPAWVGQSPQQPAQEGDALGHVGQAVVAGLPLDG